MTGKLVSRNEIAENAFEIVFSLSKPISFEPGQYVTIKVPGVKNDPRGNGRIFSLVNPPSENKIVKILFRKGRSKYKKQLLKMPVGSDVKISSPIGEFAPKPGTLVFLAAGVGIAPFMSMLPVKATWFFSNKSKSSAPYLDRLPKNAHLIFTDKKERLNLDQIKSNLPNWANAIYYIAGAPEFVEDWETKLIQAGITPKNINREAFDGE